MRHILVVEDDQVNAMVFRSVLEKRGGYRVTVTEKAEEVLEWAGSGDVDLVIMDVSLAHTRWKGEAVSGVDLCRLLKSEARTASIPVLLATARRPEAIAGLTSGEGGGVLVGPLAARTESAAVALLGALVEKAAEEGATAVSITVPY